MLGLLQTTALLGEEWQQMMAEPVHGEKRDKLVVFHALKFATPIRELGNREHGTGNNRRLAATRFHIGSYHGCTKMEFRGTEYEQVGLKNIYWRLIEIKVRRNCSRRLSEQLRKRMNS
ncbi:hypothetical protein Tco_0912199 [Tanacetum coccineum]